jgi:hydroxymethylpyrimidine/phosphomethylpyrimidine kinase
MKSSRPYVLSIAGYDPTGGAGVLADVKTFEAMKVYGLAVTTSITFQDEDKFHGVSWLSVKKIKKQLYPLLQKYPIQYVKVGIIENLVVLSEVLELLFTFNKNIKVIWDPVIASSSGFVVHKQLPKKYVKHILKSVYMITPNWDEAIALTGDENIITGLQNITAHCDVYLKGGHNEKMKGTDRIWIENREHILSPVAITPMKKHGTGCVLSAALAASLALGHSPLHSCERAKRYTYDFLTSNKTNLGYHSF